MALTVVVRSGDATTPPAITFDTPRVVIGRGEACEVCLPDASVSHRHASIRQRGTDYIIMDEGSTNGTFIGTVRLSPQAPRVLRSGELIRVGRIWLETRIEQALPAANSHVATKELALMLVAEAMAAQGKAAGPCVRVVEGPDSGAELLLREFERSYVVGRGGNPDLPLKDDDASRRHLEFVRKGSHVWVKDLGSKNGTRLGDKLLEPQKAAVWPPGAAIQIGTSRLAFEDPVTQALRELERAADEPLADDESIDPPRADAAAAEVPPPSLGDSSAPGGRAAPIAAMPKKSVNSRVPQKRGFNGTDWIVALLALFVLALSLIGLFWLFRLD